VLLEVIYALVPDYQNDFGTEAVTTWGLDFGGPAVLGLAPPVRPVTLRRHLSMALPLSKSRSKN